MIAHETCAQIASDHQGSIVDEELNRLPERYRLPLYLCCIEGKSLDVAARQLGWSVGSVKGRLERGRSELRRRLLLRRVPFALGITALALTATSAQAAATTAVAPSLIASTVQAGMQYAVGRSALGYVSQHALHLAQGSWKIMSLTTLKITVCSLTLAGLAGLGGSYFTVPVSAGGSSSRGIVLEASLPSTPALEYQLALADEGPKPGVRDGERPRTAPRDGEQPRRPAAEGEQPRRPAAEGEQPRRPSAEGEQPRRPAAEGERRPGAEGAPRPNPIEGFKPQTDREAVLMQMIMQLQREVSELRRAVQTREGGVLPRREDGAARPGPREGDGAPRTGPRDGEKPRTGPRDGEQPRTGPRDGEGAKPGPREGDGAPKKE